jgi:hypothetical protein
MINLNPLYPLKQGQLIQKISEQNKPIDKPFSPVINLSDINAP